MFNLGPSQGFLQKFLQHAQPDMGAMDPGTGERSPMSVMRPQVERPQMPTFLPSPGIMPGQDGGNPMQKKRPSIFGMFGGDTTQRGDAMMGAMQNLNQNGGIFRSYGQQNQGPSQYPTSRLRLF